MSCCGPSKSEEAPPFCESTNGNTNGAQNVGHSDVSEYYGKTLSKTEDLKTNACCTAAAPPKYIRDALKNVHTDVIARYYGCGLCIPDLLEGCTVMDLG